MENSLYIPEPVALARPRDAHRFEAFSPKLARRVMFHRRPLLDQRLLLATNPEVIAFCERPGYGVMRAPSTIGLPPVDGGETCSVASLQEAKTCAAARRLPLAGCDCSTPEASTAARTERHRLHVDTA